MDPTGHAAILKFTGWWRLDKFANGNQPELVQANGFHPFSVW